MKRILTRFELADDQDKLGLNQRYFQIEVFGEHRLSINDPSIILDISNNFSIHVIKNDNGLLLCKYATDDPNAFIPRDYLINQEYLIVTHFEHNNSEATNEVKEVNVENNRMIRLKKCIYNVINEFFVV